jgi:hypothetical protein
MPQISRRHSTCLHAVSRDDPHRGPLRLICFRCCNFICSQAVASIERRLFSVISQADFETSERYYTAPEIAFALGRYEELELALWAMASQCVFDHSTLLSVADIDELVIAAMCFSFTDTNFDYANEDSRTFCSRACTKSQDESNLVERRATTKCCLRIWVNSATCRGKLRQ